jgi:hypothetical protein
MILNLSTKGCGMHTGLIGDVQVSDGFSLKPEVEGRRERLSGPQATPDPKCVEILEKLKSKVIEYNPRFWRGQNKADIKTVNLMLRIDHVDSGRILILLDWYPIGQDYIPQIFSARALREKYVKLENAFIRSHRSNGNKIGPSLVVESEIKKHNAFVDNPIPR